MTPRVHVPAGAARAASGQAGRRPSLNPAERLSEASFRLDELIRDMCAFPNARSHRELERRIAEAEDIAGEIRAVFRRPSNEHPRLQQSNGKAS